MVILLYTERWFFDAFIIQQKDVFVKGFFAALTQKGCDTRTAAGENGKSLPQGLTLYKKSGKLNRHSTQRNADVHKERCPSGLRKQS